MSTTFSLQDLLRLALPEPFAWLSGGDKDPISVTWVVTSVAEVQADEVLLLPASQLDSDTVDRAQKNRAAAVLLIGKSKLPPDLNTNKIAVVALPEYDGDIREAYRHLVAVLINQRAGLVERGMRIHTQLSQLEAEGKGLEGLAKAMFDISGKGVLIQDKRANILAEHPSSTLLTIWSDVLKQVGSLESLPEFLIDRKRAGSQSSIHNQKIPGGLERLISPIIVGEIARGYLSLVGLEREFDELDCLVLEQGCMVCAIEMARTKAIREAEKRLKGELLTALLGGDLSSREGALWVQLMGLDLEQTHVAMRFTWDAPSSPSRRRLETLVHGELSRLGMQAIVNPMGSEVICFCQVQPDSARPELALEFGAAVLIEGAREYPQFPCRCGLGAVAMELEDWRTSLRQAGQSLELARRLGKQIPLYYPDLSVYRLLFQLEHSPELIAFQEETLGSLLSYEASSELIHTLETYFEHNSNLTQAAEALFIHRNTLIYRMERIGTITGLDLDQTEDRLALQIALRAYRIFGTKKEKSSVK